jgi:serine/threonine-protein phosphatase 6 regulatory ankyrin repeat subunit A
MKNWSKLLCVYSLFGSVNTVKTMESDSAPFVTFSDLVIAETYNIESMIQMHGTSFTQASNSKGNTALHMMCKKYNPKYETVSKNTIELLLDNNASLVAENNKGKTPIHLVTKSGKEELLRFLLHRVSIEDINKKDRNGFTALDVAFLQNTDFTYTAINLLVAHGATTLSLQASEKLNIYKDAHAGRLAHVKLSYIHNPDLLNSTADISSGDNLEHPLQSVTPLNAAAMGLVGSYASARGIQKTISFLLEKRARINLPDWNGNIPLHYVAYSIRREAHKVLKMLLEYDSSCVDVKNHKGSTPLHQVASGRIVDPTVCLKHMRTLLYHNAQLNTKNNAGKTALYYAVKNDRREMVASLLKNGASCMLSDDDGNLPIHAAAAYGTSKGADAMIDLLVKNNTTCINASNRDGNTPLHIAALIGETYSLHKGEHKKRCQNIVRSLILNGAEKNRVNNDNETASDIAQRLGSKKIIALLRLDVERYKRMREHNRELIKKTLSLVLQLNSTVLESMPYYEQLLDFGCIQE